MSANAISTNSGCGCGGGGSVSVSPCGCGGTGCGSCQGQGIVRPRFFAGQLLTEDDLQLLTEYVGQKNRLHNRHLFGAGVVCGLQVTCHPCGDGRVIVHPGYALDCCGNDLTLSCAKILDINAMVRDLRRDALGGFDCGDPCPDPPKTPAEADQQEAEEENGTNKKPKLKYCLYIRYCEQPSDPVMPYSTGEDCGRAACEPTRIQEGVKFELRCNTEHDASNALIQRLCGCVGDLRKFQEILKIVDELRRHTAVLYYSTLKDAKQFHAGDIEPLQSRLRHLVRLVEEEPPDVPALNEINVIKRQPVAFRKRIEPEALETLSEVAVIVNRFEDLSVERQQAFLASEETPGLQESLQRSHKVISQIAGSAVEASGDDAQRLRDWLIERFQSSPFPTDCSLHDRVLNLKLADPEAEKSHSFFDAVADSNKILIDAFIEYLRGCICGAFNPPCLPCEESAVLLACLDLQDCKVVKICNMERTFVLSPAAIRYWLPPLQLMGNVLERLCCDPWYSLAGKNGTDPDLGLLLKQEIVRIIKDSACGISEETLNLMLGGVESAMGQTKVFSTLVGSRKSSKAAFSMKRNNATAAQRVSSTKKETASSTVVKAAKVAASKRPAAAASGLRDVISKRSAKNPAKSGVKQNQPTTALKPAEPAAQEPPPETPKGDET